MSDYNGHKPRPFVSKDDMRAHTMDKRYGGSIYERDPAYQEFVEACLMMSEDSTVGANTDLQAAMVEPHKDWQDPANTLGTMTDCYRDMSEARKDQSSDLYKESAFERQRVAEKINRSVPNEAVSFGKRQASVQFVSSETGADAPVVSE